jgi:non-heme chloroperoxidase
MVAGFGRIFFNQPVSAEFRNWFDGLGLAASGHATAMCAATLRDADLREDLAAIRVPTAILHAVHDRVCLFGLAEALNAGIAGSQLMAFERGGHGFFYEERERVNAELLRFLGQEVPAAEMAAAEPARGQRRGQL